MKRIRRLESALAAAVLLPCFMITSVTAAPSADELERQKETAESEAEELQAQLTELLTKVGKMEEELIATGEKIAQEEEDLNEAEADAEEQQEKYTEEQEKVNAELEEKQAEIDNYDELIQAAAEAAAQEAQEQNSESEDSGDSSQTASASGNSQNSAGTSSGAASGGDTSGSSSSGSSSGTTSGDTSVAQTIVNAAYSQLGVPYVYGGTTPGVGLDCSGLVQYCHSVAGISLPRTSQEQGGCGVAVSDPQPGDIVCYGGHVSIYIGDGKMIHAPQTGDVVKISDVYGSPWYRRCW